MSNGVPSLTIAPLTLADTHLAPVDPQFLQMVSDHFGDVLTTDDGTGADINAALLSIDADSSGVDGLTSHIADADFVEGAFATASTDPIAGDIQTFTDGGNTIVGEAGTTVTPTPPAPAPAPAPAPSTGGGGGGGSPSEGGGAGSVPVVVVTIDPFNSGNDFGATQFPGYPGYNPSRVY